MALWMEICPHHKHVRKITVSQRSKIWENQDPTTMSWIFTLLPTLRLLTGTLHGDPSPNSQAQHHELNLKPGPRATMLSWSGNLRSTAWGAPLLRTLKNRARPILFPCMIIFLISLSIILRVLSLKYQSCQEPLKKQMSWITRFRLCNRF